MPRQPLHVGATSASRAAVFQYLLEGSWESKRHMIKGHNGCVTEPVYGNFVSGRKCKGSTSSTFEGHERSWGIQANSFRQVNERDERPLLP